ncbi:MAG TPA: hypothetical protein VF145_10155 [Chitinophagaceae bacterium]
MRLFTLLLITLPLIFAFNRKAAPDNQSSTYDQLAARIEQLVAENAIVSSGDNSVIAVKISRNGEVEFALSDNRRSVELNLFGLYKTQDMPFGIQYGENTAVIVCWLSKQTKYNICFADKTIAAAVYEDLLELLMAGKDVYTPDLPLDINETVDSINRLLDRIGQNGYHFSISLSGDAVITSKLKQFFHFNIADLENDGYAEGFEVNGIEMIPCTLRNVAPNSFIMFKTKKGGDACLKFYMLDDADLNELHQLFIYLRSSVKSVMYS